MRTVDWTTRQVEPIHEVLTRLLRCRARHQTAETFDRRSQEALAEGSLQLDLFKRQLLFAAVHGESLLNHRSGVRRGRAGEPDEDHQDSEADDYCQEKRCVHRLIPRWRPLAG